MHKKGLDSYTNVRTTKPPFVAGNTTYGFEIDSEKPSDPAMVSFRSLLCAYKQQPATPSVPASNPGLGREAISDRQKEGVEEVT